MICCICRQDKNSSAFHDKYHEASPLVRKCLTCVTGYWNAKERRKQPEQKLSPAYKQEIPPGYRYCLDCKEVLLLTKFDLDGRTTDGFRLRCMSCGPYPLWAHSHLASTMEWPRMLLGNGVSMDDIKEGIQELKAARRDN